MKPSTVAAAMLVACAGGAAAGPTQSPKLNNHQLERSLNNYCRGSTFENQSTDGSPLVSDCQKISRNIAGGGDWTITLFQRQIVQYGSCAFGIVIDGGSYTSKIGNQDIMDIIKDSINKFQWKGKVGAKGRMRCFSGAYVTWGLYHT